MKRPPLCNTSKEPKKKLTVVIKIPGGELRKIRNFHVSN
jgi:hypothetical protein